MQIVIEFFINYLSQIYQIWKRVAIAMFDCNYVNFIN